MIFDDFCRKSQLILLKHVSMICAKFRSWKDIL